MPRLERNPEAELQLPHLAVGLQTADNAISAAINTGVGIAIDGVVEHIEELRLELRFDPLRDGEVLEDGHVRQEFSGPREAVALDIPELGDAGIGKRTALRHYSRAIWRAGARILRGPHHARP